MQGMLSHIAGQANRTRIPGTNEVTERNVMQHISGVLADSFDILDAVAINPPSLIHNQRTPSLHSMCG